MSVTALAREEPQEAQRDRFLEQVLGFATGTFALFSLYLGDRLGYYRILDEDGALNSKALAERSGTHERYTREWLEQQVMAGILEVEDASREATERLYILPEGHREVLTDTESLNYLAPLAQIVVGALSPLERILEAYRTGEGIPFEAYGRDAREGQARMNRPQFLQLMGTEWIPAMPDVEKRLKSTPAARIADIGCGAGWSSIALAQAYPLAEIDAFDLDSASLELARENAAEAGQPDRIRFHRRDVTQLKDPLRYDLVTAFECVHDLSDPVAALRGMREMVKEEGAVLIVDERVSDHFDPQSENLDELLYGFSIFHCLPSGLCGGKCEGTGTVMRTDTLGRYARDAGFSEVEILPVEHFNFYLYRLHL